MFLLIFNAKYALFYVLLYEFLEHGVRVIM